jgi:hypothetical protein
MHGERRHDEVEVAAGEWVLETAYAQIGGGEQILSAVQPSLPRPVAFRERSWGMF